MSILDGLRVLQIGDGMAAAVCGRLFADVGATVTCIGAAVGTHLEQHLNHGKVMAATAVTPVTLGHAAGAEIIICEGAPTALAAERLDAPSLRALAPNAALVYLSPYGQTGPAADLPASDLTLFCASAIARCLTGQVDDLSEPPIRPVGEQSAFIGGLAAACAGMNALLSKTPAVIDVSIQEALATLSMTELTKAGLGGGGWARKRLTDGNGATVCILPASDGYAAISPREDHQWTAWLQAMGSPEWGEDPKFRTKPDRIQNWDELHALMCKWSRQYSKQAIADLAQTAHVPSFPLQEPAEHLNSPQIDSRHSFCSRNNKGATLRTIKHPFGLSSNSTPSTGQKWTPSRLPLKGVRVLDFSWVIAGPTTTRYLAAMGAEVIKVEAPGRGDPGRASELHTVLGQAKQGIVLNLKQNKGQEIARQLASQCDIVVENFATGVMERFGLGAAQLQADYPNLIYISASGMGRTGPEANAVAYGTLLQCYAGFAGLNRHPGNPPRVGMAWLDPMCGLKLAFIAAASLWHRNRSGYSARVDFSMVEAMLWTMAEPLLAAQTEADMAPKGNGSDRFFPHGTYKCAGEDDWVGLSVGTDTEWSALCTVITELEEFTPLTVKERRQSIDIINNIITDWTSKQILDACVRTLQKAGLAAAPLMTTAGLVEDPHLRARGFWEAHEDGVLPGIPWRSDFGRQTGVAPSLGEHTDTVLERLLNLSSEEISALRDAGTLG